MSELPDENLNPNGGQKRAGALLYPPKKRPCHTDPMVRAGKHFGRTVYAVADMQMLIANGLQRLVDDSEGTSSIDNLPSAEALEHAAFETLLKQVPKLTERLADGSEEEVAHIAAMLQKGISTARADDTKGLKGAVLDWITAKGHKSDLSRHIKSDRGFHNDRTGELLCPAAWDWKDDKIRKGLDSGELAVPGEHWPMFVYAGYIYDSTQPLLGLFKSAILVSGYKHIFTSPSSVDREPKATRSGNARMNRMNEVTFASIAYVATMVRFAMSSSACFSRTDYVTDSEKFYKTVMELFNDTRARTRMNELKTWWNIKIFPGSATASGPILTDTPLARIRAMLDAEQAAAGAGDEQETNAVVEGEGQG
ncbi:hypothetical protein FIBSPDRAFT_910647 [Athelia psychrophila]|uniref:Uncharacterized protein n=1 Tax=Athelia psychrophila TaxID=1759441 RepID=A0A166KG13_9AGAM|nr:hypothetical protein FIBSPDRAFT_910647 [Fibularhizoctonia sp. CBS 109695]